MDILKKKLDTLSKGRSFEGSSQLKVLSSDVEQKISDLKSKAHSNLTQAKELAEIGNSNFTPAYKRTESHLEKKRRLRKQLGSVHLIAKRDKKW